MIIRAFKTLEEYLEELSCSKELYYEILKYNNIRFSLYYAISDDDYHVYDSYIDRIIFNPIADNVIYEMLNSYSFKYNYVNISSLNDLSAILKKYINLKVFL